MRKGEKTAPEVIPFLERSFFRSIDFCRRAREVQQTTGAPKKKGVVDEWRRKEPGGGEGAERRVQRVGNSSNRATIVLRSVFKGSATSSEGCFKKAKKGTRVESAAWCIGAGGGFISRNCTRGCRGMGQILSKITQYLCI